MNESTNDRFAISDVVATANCDHLTHHGRVKEFLSDGRVMVHFREPHRPQSCAKCGGIPWLSEYLNTGEVECMRSGCGHRHGFKEWDQDFAPEELLENVSRKKAEERMPPRAEEALSHGVSASAYFRESSGIDIANLGLTLDDMEGMPRANKRAIFARLERMRWKI